MLNDRERAYLLAIFAVDQETEADIRAIPFSPFHDRPKASEWRWMEYSEPIPEISKPASPLYAAIKKASHIDQGTGSTFEALAVRGLVQVAVRGPDAYTHLRLTTAGRKLCRELTRQRAYKPPPPGTLRERHWRALARAYAAGAEGLEGEYGDYAYIGERTWQRLLESRWGALVEKRLTPASARVTDRGLLSGPPAYRLHITAKGRTLYREGWPRYRELYPDVEAPEPPLVNA